MRQSIGTNVVLSGTIPAGGILVFNAPCTLNNDTGDVIVLNDNTQPIFAVSYGDQNPGGMMHSDVPGLGLSASIVSGAWYANTNVSDSSKGWFNPDSGYPFNPSDPFSGGTPTQNELAGYITDVIEQGWSGSVADTNFGDLPNPSEASGLYFEIVGLGKLVFNGTVNFTDNNVYYSLLDIGSKLVMSQGEDSQKIGFDASTAQALQDAGASLQMYGLNDLGFSNTSIPGIKVLDDQGGVIPSDDPGYPSLTNITYDELSNNGQLTFDTSHFTQFETERVVYVDVSNIGVENGLIGNPYNTIQEGINAAGDSGWTVKVAAGTYEEEIEITKSIILEGDVGDDEIGPGLNAPIISDTICDTSKPLNINANDVTVKGFILDQFCDSASIRVANGISGANILDNDVSGNYTGIGLSPASSGATVMRNIVHDNTYNGIGIGSSQNNNISNNIIYGNGDVGVYFKCGPGDCDSGGTVVSNNDIYNNANGIYFAAGDQNSTVTIGSGNDIHDNTEGIYINGDAGNLVIHGNMIHDNPGISSGLHVEYSIFVDASNNWWGDASGPNVNDNGPGSGDMITIIDSGLVFYRPFCIDETCTTLSSVEINSSDLGESLTSGSFILSGGADPSSVTSIEATEDVILNMMDGSSVEIPTGTIISQLGGAAFDASLISTDGVNLETLTGLGSGVVAEGALKWGIPDLHLEFDPAITLHINVGVELNGQTLNVKRLPEGSDTWTSDGIVSPATCVVSGGICTFEATKASTYVSTLGGGGSPASYSPNSNPSDNNTGLEPPLTPEQEGVINQIQFKNQVQANLSNEERFRRSLLMRGTYDYELVTQSPYPANLNPGQEVDVWVEIKNIGTATWFSNGDNVVRLGSGSSYGNANQQRDYNSEFSNSDWYSANRPANILHSEIQPGWHSRFQFKIKAPSTAGTYKAYFTPVVDGIEWMRDIGIYWEVKVR